MAQVHISEAELARDLHSLLERVRQGVEVVIEENRQPVAVIEAPPEPGRSIDDAIRLAKADEATFATPPLPDEDFARDVQAGIDGRQEPLNPSSWD
jgi:antitoxin (DNA-binding transcriptional repressor) of toxin-antitoxin stability system